MMQWPWYRRLSVQLIAMLTVALLPLGSIALFQTDRVAQEAEKTARLSLIGLTERAARDEQILIERAVGAARLFGSVASELVRDPESCFDNLSRFVAANPDYSFIGILPLNGIIDCSSSRLVMDFSDWPDFGQVMGEQRPTIVRNDAPPASGQSVFIISEPFTIDGNFAGFVSISVPQRRLSPIPVDLRRLGLQEVIMFNETGSVLTTRSDGLAAARELPLDVALADLPIDGSSSFRAQNMDGVTRDYSVVAVKGSPAGILAIWGIDGPVGVGGFTLPPVLFPLLMWAASMGVAMLAMHTLVLRHLKTLRQRMNDFSDTRRVHPDRQEPMIIPSEIEMVEQNFDQMSREILRDEAVLENAIREKNVLVKEIHHRVKNNLQLISSIINMQIRASEQPETKSVLRRIQDRVLSLATIHRDLYQSQESGRINVGPLIVEVVDNSVELIDNNDGRIAVTKHIDDVLLYPDQAVPLSLLVAEAATNAVKHIGDDPGDGAFMDVTLRKYGDICELSMKNSIGNAISGGSTGLGQKLMQAFAMQLGGTIETDHRDDSYQLILRFELRDFQPDAADY